jgi:hypothetical protein
MTLMPSGTINAPLRPVAGVVIPDSKLAREVTELVKELLARWTPSRSSCARTASGFVRWYHCKCQTTITGYERWCALGLRWRGLHF